MSDPATDFPALLKAAQDEALAVADQFYADTLTTLNVIERFAFTNAFKKIRARLPKLVEGVVVRKAIQFEAMTTTDLLKIIETVLKGPKGVGAWQVLQARELK